MTTLVTTKRFAVIGDRVGSSLSPRMHRAAYAALGLDCTYDAIPTLDDGVQAMVARVRSGELTGINVTIPHKQRVLEYVDAVEPVAREVDSANTLVRGPSGKVVAHNTDVPALAAELEALVPKTYDWSCAHALVLGTGATARSAVFALGVTLGCAHVTVRGRSVSRTDHDDFAHLLASRSGTSRAFCPSRPVALTFESWEAHPETDQDVRVIVQATSLGMSGGESGDLARDIVQWSRVSSSCAALDVVYADHDTPFVAAAESHGLPTASGRGMLARQGSLAFELWLGHSTLDVKDIMAKALAA